MSKRESVDELIKNLQTIREQMGHCSSEFSKNNVNCIDKAMQMLLEYGQILAREDEENAKPKRRNTRWTDAEDKELADGYKVGKGVAELCAEHRRTASGIVGRLSLLGLIVADDENGGKRWSDAEDEQLSSEYNSGCTLEQMSAQHKRSLAGIIGRLQKLGFEI